MGMFDRVFYKGEEYQTKDLENLMDDYTITEDGRLVCDEYHYEDVPKEEQVPDELPDELALPQIRRVIDGKDIDMNYHGYLTFYRSVGKKWHEFTAKFTDGKLVDIQEAVNDL